MSNKRKLMYSFVCVFLATVLLVISVILAEERVLNPSDAPTLIILSVILLICTLSFAVKIDYGTSVFKCRKCGNVFVPSFSTYLWAMHSLTTRYLKCTKCGEKSWCKRSMKTDKSNDFSK